MQSQVKKRKLKALLIGASFLGLPGMNKQPFSLNSVRWTSESKSLEKNTKALQTVTTLWGEWNVNSATLIQPLSLTSVRWQFALNYLEKNTKVLLTITTPWG